MDYFVVSDIHGDAYWAKRIVAAYQESGADKLVILGDILYHGPRNDLPEHYAPKEVIALLNPLASSILAVRGNCDAEVDQMVLDFPITDDHIYLRSGDSVFYATHGHRLDPADPAKELKDNEILLFGHTHVAMDTIVNNIRLMNPGSPSIPKENTKPSYIMIREGKARLIAF